MESTMKTVAPSFYYLKNPSHRRWWARISLFLILLLCAIPYHAEPPKITYKDVTPESTLHDGIQFQVHILPVGESYSVVVSVSPVYDTKRKDWRMLEGHLKVPDWDKMELKTWIPQLSTRFTTNFHCGIRSEDMKESWIEICEFWSSRAPDTIYQIRINSFLNPDLSKDTSPLEYDIYLVHHLKNFSIGDQDVQQILGSWIEVFLPKERMVLKLNKLSEDAWAVEKVGDTYRHYKKGVEVLAAGVDHYPSGTRSQRKKGYVVLELPLRIDRFILSENSIAEIKDVLRAHSASEAKPIP